MTTYTLFLDNSSASSATEVVGPSNRNAVSPFDFMGNALKNKVALRTTTSADAAATQAAVQAAIDTGTRLIDCPPGLYYVEMIELGEGQHLKGAGMYGGTTFKLPDNAAGYVADVGLQGLTAKTGVTRCQFSDLEYDGNTANNRSWGNGSAAWTANEYELTYTMGLYFGTIGERVAPVQVVLSNLYIHDTVRDSVVWGETQVVGTNLHLKNSDADHLIYESGPTATNSVFETVVCEGFSRFSLVDIQPGTSINNLTFKNLATNPTVYDTFGGVVIRSVDYEQSANITNVVFDGFSPDAVLGAESRFAAFNLFGPCAINGVSFKCSDASDTKVIDLFRTNYGLGSRGGYKVANVQASGMPANSRLLSGDDGTLIVGGDFDKIRFEYGDGTAGTDAAVRFNGHYERFKFTNIDILGTMAGVLFLSNSSRTAKDIKFKGVYMESVNGRVCTPNSRENIVFEDCDFQGASVSDLVSASFFDQVFAKNVRTGDKLYSNNGSSTQSGNAATTSFTIAHGLETTPTFYQIIPTSAAAIEPFTVSAGTTNLVVTYTTAPPNASNNLTWMWQASCTRPPTVC